MAKQSAPEDGSSGAAKEILNGLEDLLEEEGVDLDQQEDGQIEDGLPALFNDKENAASTTSQPPPPPQQRLTSHSARVDRRSRDLEDFKSLDAQMQLDPTGVQISEDRLSATISRITVDTSYEQILGLLKANNIVCGIDHEGIRAALNRAGRGQAVLGMVVARGRPPKITKGAEVVHHLPEKMLSARRQGSQMTDFERLKHALENPHLKEVKSWRGPVKIVRQGDVISRWMPARVEPGENIFGEPLYMEGPGRISLACGEHTSLSEDGTCCVADLYGFAGLIGDLPTVLPPIWISKNHTEARFVHYPSSEPLPTPTQEDLDHLLEMLWIEFGVMKKQLRLIRQRLSTGQSLPVTLPIARGSLETSGENAQLQYAFDANSVLTWNQIQHIWDLPTSQAIEKELGRLYENPTTPRFTAFNPGDLVIEKIPAVEGLPGKDIRGEEMIPEEGEDISLEAGENLVISEDQLRVVANSFGYVCLLRDVQMILFSPLWISPDKSAAYYVNLPQGSAPKYPRLPEMQDLLKQAEIRHGFEPERWLKNLTALEAGKLTDYLILVAAGTPVRKGEDAIFEWGVDIGDQQPGKVLEDGSIDFRERNLTTVVKKDDFLGRLIPPRPGVSGKDVFGSDLIPPPALNIEVITDSRIHPEPEDDGSISFFAEMGGGIAREIKEKESKKSPQRRIHIGIYPITTIEHDVDYSTGNIDFNGDVVIGGSVQAQFSVKTTGSISIGGYVESGALIFAGKDIFVKRGVVGASTELVAGGDIMAKYIQEATVRAGGDVKAGSYIFNASVRSGGQVWAIGKGEGKSRALIGGLIWAARGVFALSIGSPYNTSTRLVTGIDPEHVNRVEQIRTNMQACEEKQQQLMETIDVDSLDIELIKQKLASCRDSGDKQAILICLKRIAKIAELEQNLQEELDEIAASQRKLAFRTSINIQNELFAGTEFRIGEQTLVIQNDETTLSYHLVQNEKGLSIQKGPFRGSRLF